MRMMTKVVNTESKHSNQKLAGHFAEPDAKKVSVIQKISLGCIEHVCLRLYFCFKNNPIILHLYALMEEFKQLEYLVIYVKGA